MPLTQEDELDILDLLARYNQAIDGGEAEAWADTFVPDGLFESQRSGTHRGRDELVAFAQGRAELRGEIRHWTNNPVISGEGDEATMRVYLLLIAVDGEPKPIGTGIYEDTLRKVDGEWKFVHRKVSSDQPVA